MGSDEAAGLARHCCAGRRPGLGGAGASRVPRHHNCFDNLSTLDFSAVPAISQRIVGEERTAEQPKKSVVEAPPITTYTGPTLGVSSMAHAPTVGYYWSLEPDSGK